jgi:outer membrane protein OmpA-like peptidoglycan-associated protein
MNTTTKGLTVGLLLIALCSLSYGDINTNGNVGLVRTLSARPMKSVKLNVQLGVNYGQDKDFVQPPVNFSAKIVTDSFVDPNTNTKISTAGGANRMLSGNLSLAMGLAPIWDLAVSLPFYFDVVKFEESDGGVGDLDISTKLCIPPAGKVWFNTLYLAGTVPFGMDGGLLPRYPSYGEDDTLTNEAKLFYTRKKGSFTPMLLSTLDFTDGTSGSPFGLHLNIGARIDFDEEKRHTILGGLGIEYSPVNFLKLFVDFNMEQRISSIQNGKIFRDPAYVSPGIRITTPANAYLLLAADFCVSSKDPEDRNNWEKNGVVYSTQAAPLFGVQFSFGWCGFLNVQDADKDGVKDDDDRCPKDPEDIDGFEDSDGCPDKDNDSDGIPDTEDKCPKEAEDTDGFEDDDGCPELDNDKDGIADVKDKCPQDPEDFDGFEDKDGCPDPDNDKDGVPDSLDRCPNDAEDFDKFEDEDGCADIDNDKDGIPDLKDKCPNKPETFNEIDDADGCPDVKKKQSKMPKHQIIHGVSFKSGSSLMSVHSYRFLEPLIEELKKYPDVQIEIRGHTDSVGRYDSNMRLSQLRAESVMQYLISKGIDASRMKAVGYGPSSPIADNRSAAGRRANRRIEIVRLK